MLGRKSGQLQINGPAIDLSPAELQSVHRQISSLLPGAGGCMRKLCTKGTCFEKTGVRRRILASSCYPSFYRGHLRVGTPEYWDMMRKRKIWAEGSFAALKREHNLSAIRKGGHPSHNRRMPVVCIGFKLEANG